MSSKKTYTVEEIKIGGDLLFEKLYLDNRSIFFNYLKKFGAENDDIKDIYQDSFMVFYKNVMNNRLTVLKSSVSTYLISIGKNLLMTMLKSKQKQINKEGVFKVIRKEAFDDTNDLLSFETNELELTEEQKLLHEHFEGLGKKCKDVLTYFYFNGLTIDEIKEVGNYNSKNVVKSHKSRCLKLLKEKILNSKTT